MKNEWVSSRSVCDGIKINAQINRCRPHSNTSHASALAPTPRHHHGYQWEQAIARRGLWGILTSRADPHLSSIKSPSDVCVHMLLRCVSLPSSAETRAHENVFLLLSLHTFNYRFIVSSQRICWSEMWWIFHIEQIKGSIWIDNREKKHYMFNIICAPVTIGLGSITLKMVSHIRFQIIYLMSEKLFRCIFASTNHVTGGEYS